MSKKVGVLLFVLALLAIAAIAGCWPDRNDSTAGAVIEGEGILVGQIDSQSVEIEINGQVKAFSLGTGVSAAGISDGARIVFSYTETEERPLLLSLTAAVVDEADTIMHGEGIYTGQIDSHSVEIEVDGEARAFAIGEGVVTENIDSGSRIAFTYREEDYRPLLLSIEVIEGPVGDGEAEIAGEGIYVGQIDNQSVEIEINRAFVYGGEVSVEGIADGSLVAFNFVESGARAVLDSIEAVDEPVEGEVMHGTFIGLIDGQSVEISYFQAFALGEGVSVEGSEPVTPATVGVDADHEAHVEDFAGGLR
ncbi:MAG: hypothetical protein U1E11_04850, partial [Dethiobacteria bacterium]|nr:hypothetical protein [Dethiobacteria bacterium]